MRGLNDIFLNSSNTFLELRDLLSKMWFSKSNITIILNRLGIASHSVKYVKLKPSNASYKLIGRNKWHGPHEVLHMCNARVSTSYLGESVNGCAAT